MNPLNHVAIIMDGNGRWGLRNKNSRNKGHKEGLKIAEIIIDETLKRKIKFITLFAFSTENWKRPKKEVKFLFKLLENFLIKKTNYLDKKNIRLLVIGNKKFFSKKLVQLIKTSEIKTKNNNSLQVNLALDYGSKFEILNAIKKIKNKNCQINEKNFNRNLFTRDIPDPDILIRTGNRKRLSNFLLWQLAYSEIYFHKKLWPDFSLKDYQNIILDYKKTKRNFGNI